MSLSIADIEAYNLLFGHGFKANQRAQLQHTLDGMPAVWDIADVAQLATSIVTGQQFNGGNHRTALMVIYAGLIRGQQYAIRRPAYQLYAKLDFAFYRSQGGGSYSQASTTISGTTFDPMQTLAAFLNASGKGRVSQAGVANAIGEKVTEVSALDAQLTELTRLQPTPIHSNADWVTNKNRANDAAYQRVVVRQKIFKHLNGGSLSHSAERA